MGNEIFLERVLKFDNLDDIIRVGTVCAMCLFICTHKEP